jgi:hypothetical protein
VPLDVYWLKRKFALFQQSLEAGACDEKDSSGSKSCLLVSNERRFLVTFTNFDVMQQLNFLLNVCQVGQLVGGELHFVVFNPFNQFFLIGRSSYPPRDRFLRGDGRLLKDPLLGLDQTGFFFPPGFTLRPMNRKVPFYVINDLLVFYVGQRGDLLGLLRS